MFDQIAGFLAQNKGKRVLITIDGPCASGKTTLARQLAEAIHAEVIHTDDFVIPHAQKTAERLARPGGNCDAERLVREVLSPFMKGETVSFRRYDCRADRLLPEETLPEGDVLILEGSYCNLPPIREFASLRLFVDTPEEIRRKRLTERETPESLQRFQEKWIPLENAYFEYFGLPDAGCIIIGSPEQARPDAEGKMDKYAFILGMITAFCECVAGGCKKLALSPPLTHADYRAVSAEAERIIEKHGLLHYHEMNMDQPAPFDWILIAGKRETLDRYQALRGAGYSPAVSLAPFSALLSYDPAESVHTGYDAFREYFAQ